MLAISRGQIKCPTSTLTSISILPPAPCPVFNKTRVIQLTHHIHGGGSSSSSCICLPFTKSTAHVADAFAHRPEEIAILFNRGKKLDILPFLVSCRNLDSRFYQPVSYSRAPYRDRRLPSMALLALQTTSNANVPNDSTQGYTLFRKVSSRLHRPPKPFPEINTFVGSSSAQYHLEVARYE